MSGNLLRLESLEAFTEPFPYFTATEGLGKVVGSAFLVWLENESALETRGDGLLRAV